MIYEINIYERRKWNEDEEMIVAVNAIYAIAYRSLKKNFTNFHLQIIGHIWLTEKFAFTSDAYLQARFRNVPSLINPQTGCDFYAC